VDRSLWVTLLFAILVLEGCHQKSSSSEPQPQSEPANINRMQVQLIGPINYVALGDSTGAGVGAKEGGYAARLFKRILEARPGSKLTNLCVSGAVTEDVLQSQLDRAVQAKPTLVTLGIGINDVGHGVSSAEFAQNFEAIVSRLKSQTSAPVVIANIPDISSAPRIPEMMRPEIQRLIVLFNRLIDEIASRHGAAVFDIYSPTHDLLPTHPEFFSEDGFHPSDEGYEVWAERMWPTVARTIGAN
jgi:acyl-CoA thioesterase I